MNKNSRGNVMDCFSNEKITLNKRDSKNQVARVMNYISNKRNALNKWDPKNQMVNYLCDELSLQWKNNQQARF